MNASDIYHDCSVMNATNTTFFLPTQKLIARNLVFGILGITGNVLAIAFLLLNRRVKLTLRFAIIGLTLNDLSFACDATLFSTANWSWRSDEYFCWPVMYVALSSIVTAHLMTCLLALHNYIAVFNPLRCNQMITNFRSMSAVLIAWLLGYSIALGSTGLSRPTGLPCVLISLIPRPGLTLACSFCLICSSAIIVINITICCKLQNRRKIMSIDTTHPPKCKLDAGSGVQGSPLRLGIACPASEWTKKYRDAVNITSHSRSSTRSSLNVVLAAAPLSNANETLSPFKESAQKKHFAECTHYMSSLHCDHELSSHSLEDELKNRPTQCTSSKHSDRITITGFVRKNITGTPIKTHSGSDGDSECSMSTIGKAVHQEADIKTDLKSGTRTITLCSKRVAEGSYPTQDKDSRYTFQELSERPPSTVLPRTSKNALSAHTLFRKDDRAMIPPPSLPNYKVFSCQSTLSHLNPKRPTDGFRAEPDESNVRKHQIRMIGRIASTSYTLVILTLWSCLLTLPLIIYVIYALIWTSDLHTFWTSSFGIIASSVCCAHSFVNPLLYTWRFTAWRNVCYESRFFLCFSSFTKYSGEQK